MSEVKTYRDLYEALKILDSTIVTEIQGEDVKFLFCDTIVIIETDDMLHFSSSYFKAEQLKQIIELISIPFEKREFNEFKSFVENGCKDEQENGQTEREGHSGPENDLNEDERKVLNYLKDYYLENSFNAVSPLYNLTRLVAVGANSLNNEKADLVRTWNQLGDSRKDKIIELLAIAGDELR